MTNKNIANTTYHSVKKFVGVKVQDDGSLIRCDEVYNIEVSDFIVEIDRGFMSTMSNVDASKFIGKGFDTCKSQLKSYGIKIITSHMNSNPSKDQPHLLFSVVANEKLNNFIDNISSLVDD